MRRLVFIIVCALGASGCATRGGLDDFPQVPPSAVGESRPANGAIFRADRNVALFENAVARGVGDIVTIRLVERTNATKSADTNTKKSTAIDLPGPKIAGRPVTVNGTEVLATSVTNEANFKGSGASSQSNRLDGSVAVTVVRRLPNGNLLVRGEKWLTLNQGRECVRIQGVIRPIDIDPDNTIPSSKVADAAITYAGRGALASANAPGLLARFFNSPWLPF